MIVIVSNESGTLFSYSSIDNDKEGINPHGDDKPRVLGALDEAARFLNSVQDPPTHEPPPPAEQ